MVGEGQREDMASGFALGVDLGTSNTVAVLRWPDGRTRPLLFDGLPVMPSGVYLDGDGRLHAGRDAQRLAEADPSRYEPNPKRRVDEAALLLGDREVPTVDLLAALLGAVARGAVEATGFLPPAVLTYPAAWGARRREVLAAAATRAGWPPPHMVPEPVAAARYFADVLRRPVPAGASIAVFDFGGGTLDIAVVRNDGERFSVVGSGGLSELGGLDLDAALVEYIGRQLERSAPDAWRRLRAPETATDQRDRRRFWEDVRGAKEMLSRTASAPIAVPGVEQALHLTREELERVVYSLLRRGVFEAASVIAGCGLRPEVLAGLFLVGGSSRVPLVARLLHSELGVAPTVLEQPELPVAEGAIAELVPTTAATTTVVRQASPYETAAYQSASASPAAPPGSPAPPPPPGSFPPQPAAATLTGSPGGKPYLKKKYVWVAAAAVVAILAAAGGAYALLRDPATEVAFEPLKQFGTIAMGEAAETSSGAFADVDAARAYLGWQAGEKLQVISADLATGTEKWRQTINGSSDNWGGIRAANSVLVVSAYDYSSSQARTMYVLDAASGKELWRKDFYGNDQRMYFGDVFVLGDHKAGRLAGFDLRSGKEKWSHDFPKDQYGYTRTAIVEMTTAEDLRAPAAFDGSTWISRTGSDARIVLVGSDETAYVYDAISGKELNRRGNVGKPDWEYRAHDGVLYVAPNDAGYRIESYRLDSMGDPRRIYSTTDSKRGLGRMEPCGESRLCVLDVAGSDDKTAQLGVIDVDAATQLWRKDVAGMALIVPLGEQVLVTRGSSGITSILFDADGKELFRREMVGVRVTSGSALLFSRAPQPYGSDTNLTGVTAQSGEYTELGEAKDLRGDSCAWTATTLVCARDKEFALYRFGTAS